MNFSLKKPIMMKIEREEVQRSGRQRKRPSFFQDFENEEQNLDKILDEFEQQQMEEAKNPKPKLERKTPGSSRPRRGGGVHWAGNNQIRLFLIGKN